LLADPDQVRAILQAVVARVDVPVTLKIRTGPSPETRNGVFIAKIAQEEGIACLAVHGRTRSDRFKGHAEYDTIAAIVDAVNIPVIANGDIHTGSDALAVLKHTGAAGVMIGRAAQGNPWVFREISAVLRLICKGVINCMVTTEDSASRANISLGIVRGSGTPPLFESWSIKWKIHWIK
jgi:tRNA-dihydrouridine synthase B